MHAQLNTATHAASARAVAVKKVAKRVARSSDAYAKRPCGPQRMIFVGNFLPSGPLERIVSDAEERFDRHDCLAAARAKCGRSGLLGFCVPLANASAAPTDTVVANKIAADPVGANRGWIDTLMKLEYKERLRMMAVCNAIELFATNVHGGSRRTAQLSASAWTRNRARDGGTAPSHDGD